MLIFKFAGHLRRHFRQVEMNVETPAQGLRLLLAQSPEFKKDFLKTRIRIRMAGEDVTEESIRLHMDRKLPDGSTVLFVPIIEGSGLETSTIVLIASLVVSAVSVAYSIYMSRNMKTKNAAEAAETNTITNNSFTSAENRVGQGRPVPLLLGEMVVGSNVISLGIDTSNNVDWDISIG
ncbi:tail assembly protein [Cronobacter sakazakii]|uniref:tail assembly protein n=1 Tax=Cronobacter sakazakii TaxID=28141 RepID=UPI00048C5D22|nr:tail assembly protein [Cronobacter sakazakii]AKE97294.1 lambda tail assembly I [Cronobacter sakazakii]EJC8212567.1 tail assembly protein [Cronobacter sakazakii]EME1983519.1 tail assembly protein [Cronobacter sakazakii]EME2024672.1 tail assembly protein [Cronobacter sakazakii]EME2040930.1 tail assembly protein [Cronobacter sakazakii]